MSEVVPEPMSVSDDLAARFADLHAATGHAEAIAANPDSASVYIAWCAGCRLNQTPETD